MSKSVCVFTSTRADFGMLTPLLKCIQANDFFSLHLLVSGTHLSSQHGKTIEEILAEGYTAYDCVDIGIERQSVSDIFGTAVTEFGKYFQSKTFDILIVLGDRYEALAVATAAYLHQLPIAHIAGGETTIGVLDEAFRHSITKMASIHFTTTNTYRQRVIQLGEHPDSVHNVGGLFIDNTHANQLITKDILFKDLGIPDSVLIAVITYHPETLSELNARESFKQLSNALVQCNNLYCLFTYANADHSGAEINKLIDEFVIDNSYRSQVRPSLGSRRYLSLLKVANIVIGNSSSGIVEAPSFKLPTVNIGDRQKGRIMAPSIVNCPCDQESITKAINYALSESHLDKCKRDDDTHGDGSAAQKIVGILANKLAQGIRLQKSFYDLVQS